MSRSPLGLLLIEFRERMGLSQRQLAESIRLNTALNPDQSDGYVAVNTISRIESEHERPAKFVVPRDTTLRILAAGLGLKHGSADANSFWQAARQTRSIVSSALRMKKHIILRCWQGDGI